MTEPKIKKLALKEFPTHINEIILQDARDGLLKYGNLSICFLMRKVKCSEDMAKKIIAKLKSE